MQWPMAFIGLFPARLVACGMAEAGSLAFAPG
jgi:hypothetical protein